MDKIDGNMIGGVALIAFAIWLFVWGITGKAPFWKGKKDKAQ